VKATWEYASVRTATSDDGEVVILINEAVQDFKSAPTKTLELLNRMGEEGWELVTIRAYLPPSSSAVLSRGIWDYVLKRER